MTGLNTVLLDANVLYPAPVRDIFLQLAEADLFRVRWSDDIHEEWISALIRREPHRNREHLERTRDLMNQHARDSLVTNHRETIPSLELPDPGDRHVLAAAIAGGCDRIITWNLRDFPAETLASLGIVAENPDSYLARQPANAPETVGAALRKIRARLRNPGMTREEYLSNLGRIGLKRFVEEIEAIDADI